jgi:hypothetical protein
MTKNYWIEEGDMNIVFDAIELLKENMQNQQQFGLNSTVSYSVRDIENLRNKYYGWPWPKPSTFQTT